MAAKDKQIRSDAVLDLVGTTVKVNGNAEATTAATGLVKKNSYTTLTYSDYTAGTRPQTHTISGIEAGALYRVTIQGLFLRYSTGYVVAYLYNAASVTGTPVCMVGLNSDGSISESSECANLTATSTVFAAATTSFTLQFNADSSNEEIYSPVVTIEKLENYVLDSGVTTT